MRKKPLRQMVRETLAVPTCVDDEHYECRACGTSCGKAYPDDDETALCHDCAHEHAERFAKVLRDSNPHALKRDRREALSHARGLVVTVERFIEMFDGAMSAPQGERAKKLADLVNQLNLAKDMVKHALRMPLDRKARP